MEFKKYDKIRALGHFENKDIFSNPEHEIITEEKIDGGNFRFMVTKEGEIIVGSRTQELEDIPGNKNLKNFRRCIEFVKENVTKNIKGVRRSCLYFGECCIRHTMAYDWDKIPPFLGYDVYDFATNRYVDYVVRSTLFELLDLPMVPLINICKAKDIKEYTDKDVPVSVYAPTDKPNQQAEGVVFKNYDAKLMAKYVRVEFKEENAKAFGGSPKYSEDDSGKVVLTYCTNARIDKAIFKLVDEGHKLEMAMMGHLPKAVTKDIYEEHWSDILYSKMKLDMFKIRKQITRRCLAVLNQVITNNAFGGEKVEDRIEKNTN